jgi:rhodanese-related sulfurtransferase
MPVDNLTPEEFVVKCRGGDFGAIVDVRSYAEYAAGHIEGSRLIPVSLLEKRAVELDPSRALLLVCRSDRRSAEAAERLEAMGFRNLYCLQGGLEAWRVAGLPLRRLPEATIPLERQVRIAVGSLTVLGVLLGAFVQPWFVLVSALAGAGLVWAGVTDT